MKTVFTTGEAAEVCQVSQQTIIRCFDNGRLKGFRIPGSRFRRIPREALIDFMKDNGIPLDQLDEGKRKVLIVSHRAQLAQSLIPRLEKENRFEVRTASTSYEAGLATRDFMPELILLDLDHIDGEAITICQVIRTRQDLQPITILVTGSAPPAHITRLRQACVNEYLSSTNPDELAKKIATLLP